MQIINKDLSSFNFHFIKTDLFKTITMKVVFKTPIVKEDITKRNILGDVLLTSSKKYASRRDLNIASDNLYSTDIYTSNHRVGNFITTNFILQTLNDKYTEPNNFEKSVEFLHEIIFNPDVNNNKFNKEKLDYVKTLTKSALERLKESPTSYSLIKLLESYDPSSPVSYRMTGYINDLDNINEENLYEYYLNMIEDDYVDIFVIGNIEEDEILKIIRKYFKFRKVKKKKDTFYLPLHNKRKTPQIVKETTDNSQSILDIALPVGKLKDYDKNYSLLLGNIILGATADSKLFREVREQNSLCYTIRSNYSKLDNMLVISAGIDKKNYDKVVELITKNIEDMKKGLFTEEDIKVAKEFYMTSAESIEETPTRIISETESVASFDAEPLKVRKLSISKVTKKDIVRAFKHINIDTIFYLEGDGKVERN